jgi:hypothetical protein
MSRRERLGLLLPLPAALAASGRLFGWGATPPPPTPKITDLPAFDAPDPVAARIPEGAELFTPPPPAPALTLKEQGLGFFNRLSPPDVATTLHAALSSGGGRLSSLAAVIGVCVASVGAGTVCVVTGLVSRLPAAPRHAHLVSRSHAHTKPARTGGLGENAPLTRLAAEVPPRSASPRRRTATQRRSPAAAHGRAHETPPPAPAPPESTGEFSFEQASSSAPATPAAAPATGGPEFGP